MKKNITINFHITEKCNMKCRYCFAKYSGSECKEKALSLEQCQKIICQIEEEGFSKISFAGGEPLLHPILPELIKFAKKLGLTTMLVTNGSLLTPDFLKKVEGILNWISISVDSLKQETNLKIGRIFQGNGMTEEQYRQRIEWIRQAGMRLKINTVVSSVNKNEDFTGFIEYASPDRWKVFQVLPIENANKESAKAFLINEKDFKRFVQNNSRVRCPLVPETNSDMIDSYVMIDPQGRLYSNTGSRHSFSNPIYEHSLKKALKEGGFIMEKFLSRGGSYAW